MLDPITVASPCQADWAKMIGDEQVRFCELCKLNVYNLSGMSRAKAQALVEEREGRLCVRFYRREDGTLLTQDCPVRFRKLRRRLALLACGLAASLGALFASSRRDEAGPRPIRDIEPFATVLEWLDPAPKPAPIAQPPPPAPAPAFMGKLVAPASNPPSPNRQ